MLVLESEFGSVLKVIAREKNTLSAIIRQAWDTGTLRTLTKNAPAHATNAHISIIGHITRDELRRGIAETEIAKRRLVRHLKIPIPGCNQPRYAFGAATRDQAREIAWQDLLDLIPDHWIEGGKYGRNVSYSRLESLTKYNSSLRVVGLDSPHRIEGKYLNGVVLDEASDQLPHTFDRIVRPMLSDYRGWAWIIGAPKRQGVGAPWFKQLCTRIAQHEYEDSAFFSWPAADIVDPVEIAHARATLDAKTFAEQYEAKWVNAGGGIYYAFSREFNCPPCSHRDNMPILVGSDFNVDPMCWVLAHRIGERPMGIGRLYDGQAGGGLRGDGHRLHDRARCQLGHEAGVAFFAVRCAVATEIMPLSVNLHVGATRRLVTAILGDGNRNDGHNSTSFRSGGGHFDPHTL